MSVTLKLSSQMGVVKELISTLDRLTSEQEHQEHETYLKKIFDSAPDNVSPDSDNYYSALNYHGTGSVKLD